MTETEMITVPLPASAAALEEGGKQAFRAGEFDVLVCRVRGVLHAVENVCSHAESPLCKGKLTGYIITCPLHRAQFDIRDGKHKGPPAFTGIRRFAITESSGHVQLEVPARKLRL